jgi:hypothetical protein
VRFDNCPQIGQQSDRPTEGSATAESSVEWVPGGLIEFSDNSNNDLSRENTVPIDWIRRLLTDDNVESNSERK